MDQSLRKEEVKRRRKRAGRVRKEEYKEKDLIRSNRMKKGKKKKSRRRVWRVSEEEIRWKRMSKERRRRKCAE